MAIQRWYLIILLLLLTACGHKEEAAVASVVRSAAAPALLADSVSESNVAEEKPVVEETKRYIALRHNLVIETAANTMQAAFEAILRNCEQLHCRILSANFNRETPYQPPSASLSARIPPSAVETFLSGLGQHGDVVQHHRESEDKTDAVIDAEAKIKNLTELRDRLRAMLASRPGSIKDVIEVERELSKAQSELDAIAGVRKALANETELVAVTITFQIRSVISERSFFYPVITAWSEAGQVLMSSIGGIITFLAAALPWLVIIVPGLLGLRRLWARRKVSKA